MGDRSLVSWELGFDGSDDAEQAGHESLGTVLPSPGNGPPAASVAADVAGDSATMSSRFMELFDMPRFTGGDKAEVKHSSPPLPLWAMDRKDQTPPPIRLRMVSWDMLVRRSMEVEWEDSQGMVQRWSSWTDVLCGWFEAEKLLPSSASNIKVRFDVHTVVNSFAVQKVQRLNNCAWDTGPEEICFRSSDTCRNECASVDAIFELAGPMTHCFVRRAWNAGRHVDVEPEAWEGWEDDGSRPAPQPQPQVLVAADAAAPPGAHAGNAVKYCSTQTLRLVAAVKALVEIRRNTLSELKALEQQLTDQSVAVNNANTLSAGLGIAAALVLFAVETGGVSLLVGSALTGAGAGTADMVVDSMRLSDLRTQICMDAWNAFAVAELERGWCWARQRATEACSSKADGTTVMPAVPDGGNAAATEMATLAADGAQFGATATRVIVDPLEESATAASAATRAATPTGASTAACALGVALAAISTSVALHGWTTTKSLKSKVVGLQGELHRSMLGCLRWLSIMNQLECGICRYTISLTHEAGCCRNARHCFHARCLQMWREGWRTRSGDLVLAGSVGVGALPSPAGAQSSPSIQLPASTLQPAARPGCVTVSDAPFSCFSAEAEDEESAADKAPVCPVCQDELCSETSLLEDFFQTPIRVDDAA